MKALIKAAAFLGVVVISTSSADAGFPPPPLLPDNIFGAPPPKRIENWVRLSVLGLRTHPYPILWLSPQRFRPNIYEALIVLSSHEYAADLSFMRTYPCLDPAAKFPEKVALFVTEHSRGIKGRGCRLPSAMACGFLGSLGKLPGIDRNTKNEELLHVFAEDFGCGEDGGTRN